VTRLAAALLLLLASCGGPPQAAPTDDEVRLLRPIPDAPAPVRELVERGDGFFLQALAPHRGNDAAAALELYGRARSSYLEAQTHYRSPTPVPAPLLGRVRECVNRIAALQRLRHATPR